MTDRELMQMALDALEWCYDVTEWPANGNSAQDKAIDALRARLAQPDLITPADVKQLARIEKLVEDVDPYTAPPQREWQGLTDEEIREFEIWLDNDEEEHGWNPPENIVKYLEAKLREKNYG